MAGSGRLARAAEPSPPISGAECLRVLQDARRSGLPFELTGKEAAYRAMWDWDRASGPSKAQVIEELVTWLPVWLEQPEIGKAYDFTALHPAANVLRIVGLEVIVPLENRLLADSDSAQAELMTLTLDLFHNSRQAGDG